MRTTLTLDDDSFDSARQFARSRRISLGKAVSALVRRGAAQRLGTKEINGLAVFELPPDSPKVTVRQVKQLESETW